MNLRALLLALAAIAAASIPAVGATTAFVRPTDNGDCLPADAGGALAAGGASLFPAEYTLRSADGPAGQYQSQVDVAGGFAVEYFPTYKLVTNRVVNETYALYQCGAPPPDAAALPAGTKLFQVPLHSVAVLETVPYAYLEMLGLEDRVKVLSPYVASACGQRLLECGRPGVDPFEAGPAGLDNATFAAEVLTPVTDAVIGGNTATNYGRAFAFSATGDDALGAAEWVEFLGLFFNREREASAAFDAVAAEYAAVKAAGAAAPGRRPVLAWVQKFGFGDEAEFQISFAPYKQQLAADAGGAPLDRAAAEAVRGAAPDAFSPATLQFAWAGAGAAFATQAAARAALLAALAGADVIIDETYAPDPAAYGWDAFVAEYGFTPAEVAATPWLAGRRVFRNDGLRSATGGLDWFEGAVARADARLADVQRALRPELRPGADFVWVRNVGEAPRAVGPAECGRLPSCDAPPAAICPFVAPCGGGGEVALLAPGGGDAGGACAYEACGAARAEGAATMAAPAVVVLTVVVVVVEMLINCC